MKFLESIIVVRVFNKFISNFSAIDTHKHLFFKHSSDHQTSNNFVKFVSMIEGRTNLDPGFILLLESKSWITKVYYILTSCESQMGRQRTLTIGENITVKMVSSLSGLDLTKHEITLSFVHMYWNYWILTS